MTYIRTNTDYGKFIEMRLKASGHRSSDDPLFRLVVRKDGEHYIEGHCFKECDSGKPVFQYVYGLLTKSQLEGLHEMLADWQKASTASEGDR